ncbi:hypothetical protein ABPG77_009912 [Micractinium sp. CCAP 211/92]
MVAARHQGSSLPGQPPPGEPPPPINYIYTHLHDSIRAELDTLAEAVTALQAAGAASGGAGLGEGLRALRERYHFLEQVYKYHSSVEDEVVYPALDSKVRNVTLAYSVEHEDEEHLFEQLFQLLSRALGEPEGREQLATVRLLACKVEEIHTTLRKHLRKEEEQLLPLLLAHFSHGEQAELVAQFLCSIPLSTVEQVLGWLKQQVPQQEQAALLVQLRHVVADRLLQQLLLAWLSPSSSRAKAPSAGAAGAGDEAEAMAVDGVQEKSKKWGAPPGGALQLHASSCSAGRNVTMQDEFVCCRRPSRGVAAAGTASAGTGAAAGSACNGGPPCTGGSAAGAAAAAVNGCLYDRDLEEAGCPPSSKPPLREIYYFHQAIRSALHSFAAEARALRAAEGRVTTAELSALVERHRFIRAVCRFHSASEDDIVFPAVLRIRASSPGAGGSAHAGGPGRARPAVAADREQSPVGGTAAAQQQADGGANGRQQEAGGDGKQQQGWKARLTCQDDHEEETSKLEELGRLLGAVKAHARRGAKEVADLVCQLSTVADSLAKTMHRHMAREEAEVLPLLMRTLCAAEQRHMVWRILRAMPLRLLERVMPWVAGRLREEDVKEWLANLRGAAPRHEAPLVELLSQWARRGKLIMPAAEGTGPRRSLDDPAFYSNQTCGPASFLSSMAAPEQREGTGSDPETGPAAMQGSAAAAAAADNHQQQQQDGEARAAQGGAAQPPAAAAQQQHQAPPMLKRIRTDSHGGGAESLIGGTPHGPPLSPHGVLLPGLSPRFGGYGGHLSAAAGSTAGGVNPVDHIFQFHKALRRELREIEATAVAFQVATEEATSWEFDAAIQELGAKFQFLRGIYRAHSKAEDEIVFPALEAKETLHNVSHAYTLDHQEEEQYFEELAAVLDQIRAARDLPSLRQHAAQLSRMVAAVRASLETHVRAEEQELWPLFAEHFSIAEQEALVGVIIGNTGAEVLTTMLSWVQGSMTQEEQEAMIASLKSASKATAFEQWLDTVRSGTGSGGGSPPGQGAGAGSSGSTAAAAAGGTTPAVPSYQEEMAATLAEVAEYLAQQGIRPGGAADPGSLAADSTRFKPGWEDIFRMNQKQLEAAIRRVSNDPTLEPQRKAYLRQNIMASHYIVAQQRRMNSGSGGSSTAATPTSLAAAGLQDKLSLRAAPQAGSSGVVSAAVATAQQQQQQQQQPSSEQQVQQERLQQQQQQHGPRGRAPALPHYHNATEGILGCKHYRRRCMLVAPCCDKPFVCRLCHDEAADHKVDRYAVTEMVCLECATRQPVAGSCTACGASMARYYCPICHLFDDEPGRHIYHCPFCNFCRQGRGLGVDSFHCMSCNACMSLELFNKHRCVEQSLAGTCPVCSDRLFESKHPVKEAPCGHFMHSHCFAAYTRYSYTCPVCFKSLGDMSVYWKMIDSLLAAERLPPEYASRKQAILCNDCGKTGEAAFHFVYHKCPDCKSYNTRVL